MDSPRILVVEDDAPQSKLVARILTSEGYAVSDVGSGELAVTHLAKSPVDLVLSDWKLPNLDGMQLLELVQRSYPACGFVMMTAYGTIAHAVEAVRAGADDYLTKPFERQGLVLTVQKALRTRQLTRDNQRLEATLQERERLVGLVGSSRRMQELFRVVEKVAGTQATVLVTGESGTGKELAGRALHELSDRARGPFVAVNCAAIPEGLVEAEFFGAERGAYTGADRARPGRFEAADGGTLFLDEVGELPLAVQPRLLRALQERVVTRVGSAKEVPVDIRVIAATNRDLAAEVAAGRFREDLYYRLNVLPLRMPPLRERREDVPLLVRHFVERSARRHDLAPIRVSSEVMRRLVEHPWPGNVRELANVVERLVVLAEDGEVDLGDLPAPESAPDLGAPFSVPTGGMSWEQHERSCLTQALELAGGNRARAARLLDLPYKAFLYRLEKHGLKR